MLDHGAVLHADGEPSGKLYVLFIPSKDEKGQPLKDQEVWASSAGDLLTTLYGGATMMPPAQGKWLNDGGEIITEDVMLVHCYVKPKDEDDKGKLEQVAAFLHRMGKKTKQGEVVIVVGEVMYRIRKYPLA